MRIYSSWIPENDEIILAEIKKLPRPTPIFISGASCSGKTIFAEWLEDNLDNCFTIRMDEFLRDIDDPDLPYHDGYYPRYDVPGAFHFDELDHLLERVLGGEDSWLPLYELGENRRALGGRFLPAGQDYYLVEGFYASMAKTKGLRIFLDAEPDILRARRVSRDIATFPDVDPDKIERFYDRGVVRATNDFVLPLLDQADFIIASDVERGPPF